MPPRIPLRRYLCTPPRIRAYATLSPHTPPPTTAYEVFDEPSKAAQRDRAILRLKNRSSSEASTADGVGVVDYLRDEIGERLAERIEDLRIPPKSILELASHSGQITRIIQEILAENPSEDAKSAGEKEWYMVESSGGALYRDSDETFTHTPKRIQAFPSALLENGQVEALKEKIDCVVSGSGLHWVGDIVGMLTQVRHLLRQDGVFVGAVLGGDTLFELRTSLQLAEQERRGGIANRVSPMIDPADAPSLLNRAGFTLTTVDTEEITINFPSMWELISDLRDMGESNAIAGRRGMISRDVLIAAEGIYNELYGKDGNVPATFQIIWMIGWKPSPTQPKPLERGSGKTKLKDIL